MPYVDHAVVGNIFRSLRGRFGNAFVEKFRSGKTVPEGQRNAGKDTGLLEAIDVWTHELRQLSAKDVEHGLTCRFKYPPSADEFVQACCTREITPPTPTGDLKALPAPTLTREEAEKHLSRIGAAVKSLNSGNERLNLDWAHQIATATAAGTYPYDSGKRMAADAFYENHRPVPDALARFLSPKNREAA